MFSPGHVDTWATLNVYACFNSDERRDHESGRGRRARWRSGVIWIQCLWPKSSKGRKNTKSYWYLWLGAPLETNRYLFFLPLFREMGKYVNCCLLWYILDVKKCSLNNPIKNLGRSTEEDTQYQPLTSTHACNTCKSTSPSMCSPTYIQSTHTQKK